MFLPGWTKTIHGGGFRYHSFDPEMRTALLVRANRERHSAEFETAPVPAAGDGPARFVWAFAHAAAPEAARFTLHVNDEPVLVYSNPRTPEEADATFEGDFGASLRFRRTHTDRHGDPMGFAILTLPADRLVPGPPTTLRITSEDLGSPVWTMVFEHEVTADISVAQHPLVRRAEGPEVRWVHLSITHLGEDGELTVGFEGREVARQEIRFGRNTVPVPLPASVEPRPVTLSVEVPGETAEEIAFTLELVKEWTIHLVQHTHTDIGYTRPQPEILAAHVDFIERALDLCDATDDWPDDAKFRWTCETDTAFWDFIHRGGFDPEVFWRRIRDEGRIEVTALPYNFSEVPDEATLALMLYWFLGRDGRGRQHPGRLAMQNDVNGLAWCLADFLPSVGVDAFVMGQHSHRALACFDRPTAFWWESPSGSRILGWRGDHYHTGNAWGIHGTDIDAFGDGLFAHLRGLEEKGYPWPRIAIQYGGWLTDNAPPSLAGPQMIRRWNETYEWPRLRSATASEFLDWIREEHGDELPVHRKAWPDWWTDGFGSAAQETAAARRAQADLSAVHALGAMGSGYTLHDVLWPLLAWAEHTLGAAESVSDPLCENSVVQWNVKASYAWEAVRRVAKARERALGALSGLLPLREETTLLALNPSGFRRPGLAEIYATHDLLPPDRRIRLLDPKGREVPVQPLRSRPDGTYWLLDVPDMPALGYASLRVEVSDEPADAPAPVRGTTLANDHYEIEIDPSGTVRRFLDRSVGLDLVDPDAEWPFLSVVHERLGNRHQLEEFRLDDFARSGMTDVRVEPGVSGPVFDSLVIAGRVEGTDGVRIEVRLLKAQKRVQVVFSVRKLAVTDPEALYLAFPFALPGAVVDYEAQGGMVVPGVDQLPGSSSDWHTVQDFVRVRSDDAHIVVVSGDAPLWHLGGLNLGRFRPLAEVERPHLYSWVMNNYWVTNFRASQEGEVRFTYDLTSGPPTRTSAAKRFAAGCRTPLVARMRPPARETWGEDVRSVFAEPLPENVHLVSIRGVGWETLLLHLRETDGREAVLEPARLMAREFEHAALADASGAEVERVREIRFDPFSVRFLRVVFEEVEEIEYD